jgi:hypothetical protein
MSISETADLLELFVVVIGVVGLTVSLVMDAFLTGQWQNVRRSGTNGINKRMVISDLRNELSRTYKLAGFVVIGLLMMTIPPNPSTNSRLVGEIFRWMIVSWEVVAVINSIWGYVDRQKNIESLRQKEALLTARDEIRDPARDAERDPIRDAARDKEHDTVADGETV